MSVIGIFHQLCPWSRIPTRNSVCKNLRNVEVRCLVKYARSYVSDVNSVIAADHGFVRIGKAVRAGVLEGQRTAYFVQE